MFGEVFDTTKAVHVALHRRTTGCRRCSTSRSSRPRRTSRPARSPTDALRDFFADDDWYTDADSNAYQLPTFLGNHDMGRIGRFVKVANSGATDAELLARGPARPRADVLLARQPGRLLRRRAGLHRRRRRPGCPPGHVPEPGRLVQRRRPDRHRRDDRADDNFDADHPLYQSIGELASCDPRHPALRDGAQQHRWSSSGGPGIYAFSRIDRARPARVRRRAQQRRAGRRRRRSRPTSRARRFRLVYGSAGRSACRSDAGKLLGVTVPAALGRRLPRRRPAGTQPARPRGRPAPRPGPLRDRAEIRADVGGDAVRRGDVPGPGRRRRLAADRHRRQRARTASSTTWPTSRRARASQLPGGRARQRRPHAAPAPPAPARSPPPAITFEAPADGGRVRGEVELRAVATPDHPTTSVTFDRQVGGGALDADRHGLPPRRSTPRSTTPRASADGSTGSATARCSTYAPGQVVESAHPHRHRRHRAGDDRDRPLPAARRRLSTSWGLHLWGDAIADGVATHLGRAAAAGRHRRLRRRLRDPAQGRHQAGQLHHPPARRRRGPRHPRAGRRPQLRARSSTPRSGSSQGDPTVYTTPQF